MKVVCLGGGPAGLYLAISMKVRDPANEVRVIERNRAGDTFGWGVVFSDQTLENLRANDPVSAQTIASSFAHWDDIAVEINGQVVRSSGHGFIGIGRKRLLNILQDRARELGVQLDFETEFTADVSAYEDYDLIVASDGVNSRIRTAHADAFGAEIDERANKFVWLGTSKLFDAFEFIFERTDAGWIWAHAYRFDETRSTFIVECSQDTWERSGFAAMNSDEVCRACEKIFAKQLDGHPLITNAAHLRGSAAWINFRRVLCHRWSFGKIVLIGDAAHTAHFSIGSGTKLALEDAIKLADVLNRPGSREDSTFESALEEYREVRHLEVLRIQNSARNSTEWFETLDRYLAFHPLQFTYSLLTRSQRVSHENLRLRDPRWLAAVEQWFSGSPETAPPPLFTPYDLGPIKLPNRIVIPPMLTYAANEQGRLEAFHTVHYGARALGGAGLLIAEMTAVDPDGRATTACPGIWNDAQMADWRSIVSFVHSHSATKIGLQLSHAGPRAGMPTPDARHAAASWERLSSSAKPWREDCPTPRAMLGSDMADVEGAFVAATRRADEAGFDLIEIQMGHGYLLSSFITPVLNERDDEFGGSLENRMRFPLGVLRAVRRQWPSHKALAVRISANDWIGEAGVTPAEAVKIACMLKSEGVDIIDVSAGETSPKAKPVFGRLYQTPFADKIRNEADVPTIAVGNITEADQVNSILLAGRADLVALGRPHLADPMWTLRAAAAAGYHGLSAHAAYPPGFEQLERNERRASENLTT